MAVPSIHAKESAQQIRIGQIVPDLEFKDTRFLPRQLSEFGERPAYVIVFLNTTCPIAQRYLPKLKRLQEEFADVQFVGINVGGTDTIREIATQAVTFDMPFPFVKDTDGSCAATLGATRTPEVAVLNKNRKLVYRGTY